MLRRSSWPFDKFQTAFACVVEDYVFAGYGSASVGIGAGAGGRSVGGGRSGTLTRQLRTSLLDIDVVSQARLAPK